MKSYDTWGGPREREGKRDPWKAKEKLRSKGCKAREWRILGKKKGDRTPEKINEKIRLEVDKKKDWGGKKEETAGVGKTTTRRQ